VSVRLRTSALEDGGSDAMITAGTMDSRVLNRCVVACFKSSCIGDSELKSPCGKLGKVAWSAWKTEVGGRGSSEPLIEERYGYEAIG
jgi:hypothetical protein